MILDDIRAIKTAELRKTIDMCAGAYAKHAATMPACRPFAASLAAKVDTGLPAIIAEIKPRSPSHPEPFRPGTFDAGQLAASYAAGGAAALSVLTEEHYFGGFAGNIRQAKESAPDLPVLRKDFLHHPFQALESRVWGADAVLVILAYAGPDAAREIIAACHDLGMEALVETRSASEYETALGMEGVAMVGINSRNLDDQPISSAVAGQSPDDLTIDAGRPARIVDAVGLPDAGGAIVVAESGISCRADIERLAAAGIHAALVGSHLMAAPDVESAVRHLAS